MSKCCEGCWRNWGIGSCRVMVMVRSCWGNFSWGMVIGGRGYWGMVVWSVVGSSMVNRCMMGMVAMVTMISFFPWVQINSWY